MVELDLCNNTSSSSCPDHPSSLNHTLEERKFHLLHPTLGLTSFVKTLVTVPCWKDSRSEVVATRDLVRSRTTSCGTEWDVVSYNHTQKDKALRCTDSESGTGRDLHSEPHL